MAADGAGRRARRVEQDGIERAALPFQRVGGDGLGLERQPRQIFAQAIEPRRRAIDRGDARAGQRRAARSCRPAPRTDRATLRPRTSPSRRAGSEAAASCTHQAPSVKPGQQRDRRHAPACAPCRSAARGRAAARPRFPAFCFHGEIERRLVAVGRGDRARGFVAVGLGPAREQPVRRVARRVVGERPPCGSAPRGAARR